MVVEFMSESKLGTLSRPSLLTQADGDALELIQNQRTAWGAKCSLSDLDFNLWRRSAVAGNCADQFV